MLEILVSAISIGQIVGLFVIMEMFHSRRKSRYIGTVLILAGVLPIIKILIVKPGQTNLPYLAMWSGIAMVIMGILWIIFGEVYRNK
jgi:uncharacterized membrane protein HdeD (DUF308 family)